MAVPTVSVPKEIPLSSVIEDSFDKPIVLSQHSDFSIRISCLSSINTPLYINLTKTKHLITEMHPINHDSKRLLDRRCKDIFLRLVWHPPWETHALEWPPLTVGYFLNRKEPFGQAYSVQKMNFSIRIFSHLKPTFNRAFIAKVWEVEFVDYLAKEPYTEGAELIHFVLDMIHKETKDCDYLEGFQICPSLRGGTKFGVMIWIFMGYWYQIEQLKRLKKKGYDVLFMVDAIVEYAIGQLKEYDGREGMASKLFDEMLEGMLATYLNTYRVKRPFEFNGENDAAATARHVAGLEMYTITARLGGSGGRPEICVLSLLSLRCGVLVSADSTGSVHFWSNQQWTLLQAHSLHKGDVNALAAAPSHNRVLSTGSDGQVILYKLSSETVGPSDDKDSSIVMKEWTYVGYVRAHTHDVWTLTLVVPISREELFLDEKMKRSRSKEKPVEFIYHKWAHMGVQTVLKKKRTLVGLTTIVLTCKYKEVSVPFVEDLVLLSNEACTRKEVIDMERLMGKKFFASQKIDVVPLQIVFRPFDRGRGGVYSGIKRSTLMKINNVYVCGPYPEVWFMFQLSTHDKAIFYEGYYEHKGDKKFKGTIAVGFTIDSKGELSWHQAELRQVIAIEVANDPTEYSEAILGKPNEEYCDWIVIQGSGEATLSFQD